MALASFASFLRVGQADGPITSIVDFKVEVQIICIECVVVSESSLD